MEPTPFNLPPEQKGLLQSLSRKTGKPVDALINEALRGLEGHLRPGDADTESNGGDQEEHAVSSTQKPIWEQFAEAFQDVPEDELERLPTDLAAQVDHYVYGLPKRPT